MPGTSDIVELRRVFHEHPEPGWREFWTTAKIVDEIERVGVDEIHVGPDAIDSDERLGVPDNRELDTWLERARNEIDRLDVFDKIAGGNTGVVAVIDNGDGPCVGLRVDIDALPITESSDTNHFPSSNGFRSTIDGFMHACGHDAHITIGIGVLKAVLESDFSGIFKVFFQPSEELLGGGKAMANTNHLSDIDYLMGTHVGLDLPTGELVAGLDEALALSRFEISFHGESAHAGNAPNGGHNAVQALITAANNMYAIPRHGDGATRVNIGEIRSENAANVIADSATAKVEVRGGSTQLMEYMKESVYDRLEHAAEMHGCEIDVTVIGESIRQDCDEEMVSAVYENATELEAVESPRRSGTLGASEDATYLMKTVADNGGKATYVSIGASNPGGHHTPTFDVDEECLPIGVSVLSRTALSLLATD
ncbi:N-acyl-L-amino acid amidohydrolase [Halostagnicola sp. A56]|uniref:amidohydrolase n=1 Tax=Halostagnicola sp. A56 TaxID=1495067 RepID=UPI00049EF081|nr:amidohydrolase [Halostagnicola sp. A56]KDE60541.1 N-acyl-L-amino acid amidohydrolase [Halostagnicola sp. A56]